MEHFLAQFPCFQGVALCSQNRVNPFEWPDLKR